MSSVQPGKVCWQPETAVHLRILLRRLGATRICAHGRQLSRVLLLLLLAAILRRRLWKIKKLSAVLYHAQASIAPSAAVACNLIASVCAHSLLNWHGAWDQSADQGWMFTLGGGGGGPGGKAGTLGALCALCAGGGGTAFAP